MAVTGIRIGVTVIRIVAAITTDGDVGTATADTSQALVAIAISAGICGAADPLRFEKSIALESVNGRIDHILAGPTQPGERLSFLNQCRWCVRSCC
jgi:hypothetical protein